MKAKNKWYMESMHGLEEKRERMEMIQTHQLRFIACGRLVEMCFPFHVKDIPVMVFRLQQYFYVFS